MRPILSAFLGSLVLLATLPAAAQLRAVSLHGDPVPGHPDETIDVVDEIVPLGGDRAVFEARMQGLNRHEVVVVDDGGAQTAIAAFGDAAPGGGTFDDFDALQRLGTGFGFVGTVAGEPAVFAWTPATGLRQVVRGAARLSASNRDEILVDTGGDVVFLDPSGMAATVLRALDPIPGDPTFAVESIERAEISSGGLITIYVGGTNADRSVFRTYFLQGTIAGLALVASTLDIPRQSGDMAPVAISRSGAIAYTFVYTTETGSTVRELWIESGGIEVRAFELVDATTFPVGGRSMAWSFIEPLLSDDQRLFALGTSGTITLRRSTWAAIHFDADPLPGGAPAQLFPDGLSSDGQALFHGGGFDATALYLWSESGGLVRVVGTGDALPGHAAPETATSISDGGIAPDGSIAFVASYRLPDGVTTAGGWMTGSAPRRQTDLRAVRFAPLSPDADRLDGGVFNLVLEVENRGPTDAAFEVRFVEARVVPIGPTACSVSGASCTCTGTTCATDRVVPVGETLAMRLLYAPFERTPLITATVVPIGADESMPADNEIELGASPGGGCSIARGRAGHAPLVLLALAALLARRRRRAAR